MKIYIIKTKKFMFTFHIKILYILRLSSKLNEKISKSILCKKKSN